MKIGICGLGTVGSGVFNLIAANGEELARKTGETIAITQVGARRDHPDVDLASTTVTRDIFDVANNPEIDVLVELIGGTDTALNLVLTAINNGKHVVTANKALIALHGHEVFAAAAANHVQVRYEASVAGGIPIIKAVREGLSSNRIEWLAGIINGTTNFILTEMAKPGSNLTFADVLAEAQALGYAEADPTFDVEGIDAAHKLTILASVAFGIPLGFDAVYTEGISGISARDIRYSEELGYRIRHLGIARRSEQGVELRVHPTLVASGDMLAQVSGVMNAVMVGSDPATSTMYYGPGAGAGPTASSVVADIVDLVRGATVPNLGFMDDRVEALPLLAITAIQSAFYLRLSVPDKPGVMAAITTELSRHAISIEAMIQKDARGEKAEIVLITDVVTESEMDAAIASLEATENVLEAVTKIRVTEF